MAYIVASINRGHTTYFTHFSGATDTRGPWSRTWIHRLLSLAILCQLFTPSARRSDSTPSTHRIFGRATPLHPSRLFRNNNRRLKFPPFAPNALPTLIAGLLRLSLYSVRQSDLPVQSCILFATSDPRLPPQRSYGGLYAQLLATPFHLPGLTTAQQYWAYE